MPNLPRRPTGTKPIAAWARAGIAALIAIPFAAGPVAANPPSGLLRLVDVAPGIAQDIRYVRSNNFTDFTGARVPGYAKPDC